VFESPGIEHERLCETDTTSIINKFIMANVENAILSSRFVAFDNRPRHLYLDSAANDQIS